MAAAREAPALDLVDHVDPARRVPRLGRDVDALHRDDLLALAPAAVAPGPLHVRDGTLALTAGSRVALDGKEAQMSVLVQRANGRPGSCLAAWSRPRKGVRR